MTTRLAFYRGKSWFSKAIRWFTRGAYSHVAIVESDTRIIEAWHNPSKVRVIQHLGEGHESGTQVDVFEFDVRHPYLATLYLDGVIGTKYDFLGIFGFLLHRNTHSRSKVFCSELAMEYSTVCGTPLLGRIPPYKVSPSMLATSPLLRYVGTTTTRVDNTPMPSGPSMSEDEEVKAAKVIIRPSRKKKKRADTSKIEREK